MTDGSLIAVRETHPVEGEAVNELVTIGADGTVDVIASGCDFYSTPRLSPDGTRLAWIEWDHPNMPWDGTRLVVADAANPDDRTVIAGGDDESIVQPEWAPDGTLVFASDRTGWWNLYRYDGAETAPILEMEAEFAGPAWVFGESWYGFLSDGRIATSFYDNGQKRIRDHRCRRCARADRISDSRTTAITSSPTATNASGLSAPGPTNRRRSSSSTLPRERSSIVRSNPSIVDAGYVAEPRVVSFPDDR